MFGAIVLLVAQLHVATPFEELHRCTTFSSVIPPAPADFRPAAAKVFNVTAKQFEFVFTPDLVVDQGDSVTLNITAADVTHGFALEEYMVQGVIVEPGKPATVNFVAHRPRHVHVLLQLLLRIGTRKHVRPHDRQCRDGGCAVDRQVHAVKRTDGRRHGRAHQRQRFSERCGGEVRRGECRIDDLQFVIEPHRFHARARRGHRPDHRDEPGRAERHRRDGVQVRGCDAPGKETAGRPAVTLER